jgi:peptidoglycan/xylan/chitin deacetylase (PgdA/CDA1 family)
LGELESVLRQPRKHRRTVFLMADDGYANTLHTAAGVLEDFGLPWTLFVSTRHIDTGEPNPMFLARMFLRHMPEGRYVIPPLPEAVLLNGARRTAIRRAVNGLRSMRSNDARQAIDNMQSALSCCGESHVLSRYTSERFLTWDEVRLLATRGVTIGAHADWHWAMHDREGERRLREQAEKPRRRIEAEVGPCRHFAYPFGNVGDVGAKAWRAVRDAGYAFAFTTLAGALSPGQNPWLLPRYGLQLQEPHLTSLLPLLRIGNSRVKRWQRALA